MLQENGAQDDGGHVPGLGWVPEAGHQVRILSFTQERIQEQAIPTWKQVY